MAGFAANPDKTSNCTVLAALALKWARELEVVERYSDIDDEAPLTK